MKYDYAVFIGRMQPPHIHHIGNITHALSIAKKVIVVFGSHRSAPNIKNPWTVDEREDMLRSCFDRSTNNRIQCISVRDYYYNDNSWFADLQQKVRNCTDSTSSICVVGCKKDESSWYLDALPERWKREFTYKHNPICATDVRKMYFEKDLKFSKNLHVGVATYMKDWAETDLYEKLKDEYEFIKQYRDMWAQAPYPVTFNTTDAVVVKNGHVLVVRRKFNPGKGLLALPGGFVNQNEKIIDSAFRELKEETRILVPKQELMKHIADHRVFDHPDRSLRGRTITHAYCIKLPDGGDLPGVKGNDDAEHAIWIPVADLFIKENEFYEDHLHIIQYFINRL